jgi:long-chain acyl-CoA synthetase
MSSRSAPPHSAPSALLQSWQALVDADPQAAAVIEASSGRVFSRQDIEEFAETLLNSLVARGEFSGRRIAFAFPNSARWIASFLAILRAGGTAVPLDAAEPASSQQILAQAAGAAAILGETGVTPFPGELPNDPSDACLVKLTSGTTGAPRPLLFTHQQMLADGHQVSRTMDIRPTDLNIALIPFGHSYGLGNLVVPLLLNGTPCLCSSGALPHIIAAECERWKPTVFPAVPAMLRVLSLSDVSPAALQSLRVIVSAGSPLTAEVAQSFHHKYNRLVHGFYGSSETGGITYDRTGDATLAGRSVGTPLEGVRLIFDAEKRFWVESAAVYTHGNPHAASAAGRHQPADTGELNAEGELVLLGRTGRMMKIAGRRLDLSDFENQLRRIPHIRDAFAAPHPERPEELAVALATHLSQEEARAQLRAHLAPWKVPRRILVLVEFPLTARGKPDTRALSEQLSRAR